MDEELVAAPDTPQGQHGERDQVGDEVVVVPLSNAVAHPGAVVVKPGNTHITCCQAPDQAQSQIVKTKVLSANPKHFTYVSFITYHLSLTWPRTYHTLSNAWTGLAASPGSSSLLLSSSSLLSLI